MIIWDSKNYFLNELKKEFNNSLIKETTIIYLSDLLNKFMINNEDSQPKYLALIIKEISEAPNDLIKNKLLLSLGEQSLIFSSFFPSIIYKRNVNLDYYMSIGSGAYMNLAQKENIQVKKETYENVSINFKNIINGVSVLKKGTTTDFNKINLISAWQETENVNYLKLLLEQGIIPAPKKSSDFNS